MSSKVAVTVASFTSVSLVRGLLLNMNVDVNGGE